MTPITMNVMTSGAMSTKLSPIECTMNDNAECSSGALMSADPNFFIEYKLSKTKQGLSFFGKEALEEYKRCFRNPETVRGMCEDYRACATIDLAMDTADFAAGKKITCPVQLLWGATGQVGRQNDPPAIWKHYATDIRDAQALPCGHYLSEEAPEETYRAMRAFFTS